MTRANVIDTTEKLLAAMQAMAARHKGKRGRPPADSIADIETGMRRFAFEVFTIECALGACRGDRAKAIRKVALDHGIDEVALNRAVSRHRNLRPIAHRQYREQKDWVELRRRMRNFPPLVRRWIAPFDAEEALKILRAAGIDGDCPDALIEAARTDLMSQK